MRVLGAVLGIVLGMGALAGTIWLGRYSPLVTPYEPHRPLIDPRGRTTEAPPPPPQPAVEDKKDVNPRPPVATKEPFPKAVTGVRVFDFGSMGVNEEKKHTFSISNRGQGPLELEVGPCTCKCTVGGLSKKKVLPGEKVDVELAWRPKEVATNFAQQCTIWTSDPDSPEIQFKVYGKVDNKYQVIPERVWHAGHVTDVQEGTTTGQVISTIEKFKVTSVESTNPHVQVTFVPLDGISLMGLHGKAGFEFTVKADRELAIGTFRVPIRIHTTLEGNKTIEIDVTGTRSGPMLFLPPRSLQGSAMWLAEKSRLSMGRVRRELGKKVSLPAIIYGIKDKFQILKTTSDADYLKVSIAPNPEIAQGEQQGVLFVFELPKNSPGETRVSPNSVHVTLATNHPKLKEIHFEVEFICQ
ncbi:MAG TPA: DUF1573 domain-containing protein [Planctomycetaceae bacterium]|nr:DUF1573 domain-containing protein [Planctomycetaceae bacterium]